MKDLIITVVEIKGNCPVYKKGNKIFLDEGGFIKLEFIRRTLLFII